MFLDQLAFAANAVERLERSGLGHVAQEPDEGLAFAQVTEPAQGLDDERGVAQPAVAVVPGPLAPECLGHAGRGGGDDGAGVVVGVQLQAERRSQHRFGSERRQGVVRAHARHPAMVSSRALATAADES